MSRCIVVAAVVAGALLVALGAAHLRNAVLERRIAEKNEQIAQRDASIVRQNAAVQELRATTDRSSANAGMAALRVLRDGSTARAAIERAGSGPEEMNRWVHANFAM